LSQLRSERNSMPILIILLIMGGLVGAINIADYRMKQRVKQEAQGLLQSAMAHPEDVFQHESLSHLPQPVQQYLKRCIPDGYPMIYMVRLEQTGKMSSDGGTKWFPFTAVQHFTTRPKGFVWLAYGRVFPLVWVLARDKYVAGKGNMLIKPESLITLADAKGPQLDQGALARYLAEMMWFPTGFLDDSLRWKALDERHARVTIHDHALEFTMTITFTESGDIAQVEGLRYRESDGEGAQPICWGGKVISYNTFNDVRIPSEVEVYWNPSGSYEPYWRGTITAVSYNTPEL
jgi:hypothetical protein